MTAKARRARMYYERRIFFLALMAGLPGSATALIMLWTGNHDPKTQWTLTVLIAGFWLVSRQPCASAWYFRCALCRTFWPRCRKAIFQ